MLAVWADGLGWRGAEPQGKTQAMDTHAFPAGFTMDAAGHRLTLYPQGPERMTALAALIAGAQSSLALFYYMFNPDAAGLAIRTALTEAAARGVRVTLIVDAFGSSDTGDEFFAPLRAAGGEVHYFSRRWRTSYLIRNHQKMAIADGVRMIGGGFNIASDYFAAPEDPDGWADLGLMIEGPGVARMADWFDAMRGFVADHDGNWFRLRRLLNAWDGGTGDLQWMIGGPTQRLSPWARAMKRDLLGARQLDMAMAYFSPGQGMLRRIARVAKRGRARLILPAKSDNGATIGAARLLYGYLLKRRVSIAEYQPSKLHMKLMVIDDAVYIGSANFDMRSLYLNLELMVRIRDAAFADRMRSFIADHAPLCEEITPELHRARAGWLTRLRWTLSWFVVAAVDYTVARRLNFGLKG
jgi:cardiolipin synthase